MQLAQFIRIVVLSVWWAAPVLAQNARPAAPPTRPASTAPADSVAVSVNGHNIMESDVENMFQERVAKRMPVDANNAQRLVQMRQQFRTPILQQLIDNWLLDEQVNAAGLKLTDQDVENELNKGLEAYLLNSGMTRREFEEQLQASQKMTLSQWLAEAKSSFRQNLLQAKLIIHKYAEEAKVADDDIKSYYDKNREQVFQQPEKVRASHILIATQPANSPEQLAAARKQVEEILAEAKKPGADFAALAGKHSACPSKTRGGDLGFFAREGPRSMVPEFSAAAFALQPGQISGIVATQFGYHIIKGGEKMAAQTVSFERAKDLIHEWLQTRKVQGALRPRYLAELRNAAKIVYPPGKEPVTATRPATTRPAMRGPSTRPGQATTRPVVRMPRAIKAPTKPK